MSVNVEAEVSIDDVFINGNDMDHSSLKIRSTSYMSMVQFELTTENTKIIFDVDINDLKRALGAVGALSHV